MGELEISGVDISVARDGSVVLAGNTRARIEELGGLDSLIPVGGESIVVDFGGVSGRARPRPPAEPSDWETAR